MIAKIYFDFDFYASYQNLYRKIKIELFGLIKLLNEWYSTIAQLFVFNTIYVDSNGKIQESGMDFLVKFPVWHSFLGMIFVNWRFFQTNYLRCKVWVQVHVMTWSIPLKNRWESLFFVFPQFASAGWKVVINSVIIPWA